MTILEKKKCSIEVDNISDGYKIKYCLFHLLNNNPIDIWRVEYPGIYRNKN